jgi:hypothetical protein
MSCVAGFCGAAVLIGATPAAAGAATCPRTVITHAFASFGDNASYSLVEGGLFESGAPGWSLRNARIVNGGPTQESSRYDGVGSDSGSDSRTHSLAIDSDGHAVSAPFCVDSEHPSFRFLTKQLWGGESASLEVSLRWSDSRGTHETSDATIEPGGSWTLSPVMELASKLPAGVTPGVRLVFQPSEGSYAIDDVYIDPYSR